MSYSVEPVEEYIDTFFIESFSVLALELKATGLAKPADGKKYKGKLELLRTSWNL